MEPEEFLNQAELLTGSDVKSRQGVDRPILERVLADDTRQIDCSQFNELLLLVHKDRVGGPFFRHFFGAGCSIGQIPERVEKFRKVAMLLYGDFVYAYRTLSRMKEEAAFQEAVQQVQRDPAQELDRFAGRHPMLVDIDKLSREQTPHVGYLSATAVTADLGRCDFFSRAMRKDSLRSWSHLVKRVEGLAGKDERGVLLDMVRNYRRQHPRAKPRDFERFTETSLSALQGLNGRVRDARRRAEANQNIYLSWDHMDIYFATSMRQAWEYRDLYDFIGSLMRSQHLRDLNLRYFDPTQAYTGDRINKSLIEALMLKRARCTVYSVQDTDTLGKDSELASTLAQGKPVIAYVPTLEVARRSKELEAEDPSTVLGRLRYLLYADEQLPRHLPPADYKLVGDVQDSLLRYSSDRIWPSLPDLRAARGLKGALGNRWPRFCFIIAEAERRLYDARAKTLTKAHPLALQVNLDTGVANGVLVVRSVADCAKLLRRVLLFEMEFTLEKESSVWCLRETISGCVYRVVTTDRKLSNCFWNFYLR